jgi:hypothetical protein
MIAVAPIMGHDRIRVAVFARAPGRAAGRRREETRREFDPEEPVARSLAATHVLREFRTPVPKPRGAGRIPSRPSHVTASRGASGEIPPCVRLRSNLAPSSGAGTLSVGVPAVPHTGNRLYARISNCRVNPLAGGTRWPCGNEIMPCWMVMSAKLVRACGGCLGSRRRKGVEDCEKLGEAVKREW